MAKRNRSGLVLKKHRSIVVELLPHDVVELILERLPVKSLERLKCVCKKWKSTIESRRFKEEQLICRKRSPRGPDVIFVGVGDDYLETRIVLGSSTYGTARFPTSENLVCYTSCDGLVCLFCILRPNMVVNPATKWHQSFPFSYFQELNLKRYDNGELFMPAYNLGFGKDKFKGTFKPVWLYNSSEYGLANVTTCEVFDFSTNAWRYVSPASPYRILPHHKPLYFDGSIYWFTECEATKVLSFHLHTETFQVLSKAPFAYVRDRRNVLMSVLDNRLCVSEAIWPTQVIWSFDSGSNNNKTWNKICSIDLTKTVSWFGFSSRYQFHPLPVAILDKNKLLLHGREYLQPLVIYDLHTKSFDFVFKPTTAGYCLYHFESLLSV